MSNETLDIGLVEITALAMDGHFEPLAKHIESGGHLDPQTRKVLVAYLRNEIKFKAGNRRTYQQEKKERAAAREVYGLQCHFAFEHGKRGCRDKAIKCYLDRHEDAKLETLKGYLKNFPMQGVQKALFNAACEAHANLKKNGVGK
jgi:hypothetical protein